MPLNRSGNLYLPIVGEWIKAASVLLSNNLKLPRNPRKWPLGFLDQFLALDQKDYLNCSTTQRLVARKLPLYLNLTGRVPASLHKKNR